MQTIEARAILSASDRTGGIFSQIAAKIKGMNAAAATANRSAAATAGVAARASQASAAANTAVIGAAGRVLAPAAIAVGAARAYQNYSQTELQIKRIGITADATSSEVAGLNKTMRDTAISTGQSFAQIAKGLESLTAGGLDLKDALPAMPAIAKTAQAAGAEVEDMATTTLALNQNLKISTDSMQNAFDILVKGGKAGKFELKDMARYIPSIAPAAVAIGMKGEQGLMRLVAALQTVRNGTGSTEEAADSMLNIFAKMESNETTKKFKKFGIDLTAEMKKARAEGKDLLEVFIGLSEKAMKGDLSKVPQLFSDMQFARGMRALLSYKDLNKKVMEELSRSAGSTEIDFQKVMQSPVIAMNRLRESVDRTVNSIGAALERLPRMFGSDKGLSDMITSKAQQIQEKGLVGILPEADQKDAAAITKAYEFITSEKKQLDFSLRNDDGTRQTAELRKARLRRFDLQRAEELEENLKHIPSIVEELEANKTKYQELPIPLDRVMLPAGDPRKRNGFVPLPLPDERKAGFGSDMPPAQGFGDEVASALKNVKAELTGSAEVKGETEVKVTVEAGSELLRIVDGVKSAVASMVGRLTANGPGSTGRSSPDAAPSNVGASAP